MFERQRLAQGLEAAATTTTEAATREAATASEAGASRTARCGGHGGTGERRHRTQATDEHIGVEGRAEAALYTAAAGCRCF